LNFENITIPFQYQVVDEDFPIPYDGIWGIDFIKNFNCLLDFCQNGDWLILRPKNYKNVSIPIYTVHNDHTLILPARSEVIREVEIQTQESELFIPNQEIKPGIFIANTIVSAKRPFVRIVNTNSVDTSVSNSDVLFENLSDYDIIDLSKLNSKKPEILKRLSKNFPKDHKHQLTQLCTEFSDIFGIESEAISTNNFYKQELHLSDPTPVYIKNYKTPHAQKDEIENQVKKLINDKIVEPSISAYNSPLLLVPKKSLPNSEEKRWRLVIDYRQINKKLIADKFPLPRIDDILDQLGRAKYFSCLDLMSGFYQIELDESSRDITSFSTSSGSYRFTRLPYGLKVAPNSFQRMMTFAFAGLAPAQAFLYMDDLIVLGCSEKHMIKNLRDVFSMCRKHNLKLHPDKCSFFMREVTFLGHKCTDHGILPDDSKFKIILNYPRPQNADQAKRFVAFCNYYRKFIKNFAEHSRHITKLCKKHAPFHWTEECEKAFLYLKNSLISPQILQYPDFSKTFVVTTDASKHACGAMLSQDHNGIQLPVSYASKAFTKGESNKSTIEQELTAIHWAIVHFRPYLYGKKFLVRTDHRPLTYLFSMKNPSSKLTRIRLDLEEYDFEVEYLRGRENFVADALSRINIEDLKNLSNKNNKIFPVTTRSKSKQKLQTNQKQTDSTPTNRNEPKIFDVLNINDVKKCVKLKLSSDNCFLKHGKRILTHLKFNDLVTNGNVNFGKFFPRLELVASNYNIKMLQMSPYEHIFKNIDIEQFKNLGNKYLINLKVALLPKVTLIKSGDKSSINEIIQKYHDNPITGGHSGITRTISKIKRYYYWRGMTKHISKYIKSCEICKKAKINKHIKPTTIITPTPAKAFERVIVDTVGPLPKTERGNEYAVTIICDLTKYLVTVPIPNKQAKTVAKALIDSFILIYGPMKTFISDLGTEYKNQILNEICDYLKIEKLTSTAYHHQTLGTVERSHRTLNAYLRSYISIDKDDWDDWLTFFTYCYNTTPSAIHNYCPFELVFAKTPIPFDDAATVQPLYNLDDYAKEAKFRLQIANERVKHFLNTKKLRSQMYADKNLADVNIKVGDKVLIRNEVGHKLENRYLGPYVVIAADNKHNFTLNDDNDKPFKIHKSRLKLFD